MYYIVNGKKVRPKVKENFKLRTLAADVEGAVQTETEGFSKNQKIGAVVLLGLAAIFLVYQSCKKKEKASFKFY